MATNVYFNNYPSSQITSEQLLVEDLVIEWMPIGTEFEVDEYDGSESIRYKENEYWITA